MNTTTNVPTINFKRLSQLAEEFTIFWMHIHALYLDSVVGFEFIHKHVSTSQRKKRTLLKGTELDSEQFMDNLSFTYSDIFAESFCASSIHQAKQGEVKKRCSTDGDNYITLGQLCTVAFFDYWNDYLRKEYVIAKGYLSKDEADSEKIKTATSAFARFDLWGDLRYLRTSIVHNNGKAISDVSKCKLIHWFLPGARIALTPDHMRKIFLALLQFRNDLHREQFSKSTIKIPAH